MDGSQKLAVLGIRLKTASNGVVLRRELLRNIRATAKPLQAAVKTAAERQLPHTGGLNEQVASQRVSINTRLTGRNTGVRLTTTAPDTGQTDHGFVRHPTFGRRGRGDWRTQQIPQATGWWSRTLRYQSPAVTKGVLKAMDTVSKQIQGGL